MKISKKVKFKSNPLEIEINSPSPNEFIPQNITDNDSNDESSSLIIIKDQFPHSIEAIQEVDESNFTTDEKFKISPSWVKHKSKIIPGEEGKIPFNLEEEPIYRIGSGSKQQK